MIIVLAHIDDLKEDFVLLPKAIKDQGANYAKGRQLSFFSGRLLLKKSLEYFFAYKDLPPILIKEHGRPSFYNPSYPLFSISHSAHMVALSLSDKLLGIDLEMIKPRPSILWQRVLSQGELDTILKSDNPHELFTKLWTVREALLKATGRGLGALASVRCNILDKKAYYAEITSGIVDCYVIENFCLSIYHQKEESQIYILDRQKFIKKDLLPNVSFKIDN